MESDIIWVKVEPDGSLGRAYDKINQDATPPPGVRYVAYRKAEDIDEHKGPDKEVHSSSQT